MQDNYEEFVEKFKYKRTSDDCYTLPDVYDNVLKLFEKITGQDPKAYAIIRPFYPGGDYERAEYPPDCIVIDNPPFSIMTKIVKFYNARGIKYFLFAPLLTLFGLDAPGYVIVHDSVTYENGAKVSTGFVSNCFSGIYGVKRIQDRADRRKEKTKLPADYESAATMRKYCKDGEMHFWAFHKDSRIRKTPEGKPVFGCAYKVEQRW